MDDHYTVTTQQRALEADRKKREQRQHARLMCLWQAAYVLRELGNEELAARIDAAREQLR